MDSTNASLIINAQSTDLEIFLAIQAQQVKALDLLYDRYNKLVFSTAVRILNNVEEAEEVTQETFLRLWQRSGIYQPQRGSLSSFLITLSRSRALDRVRARSARQQKIQRIQTHSDFVSDHNPPLESVTVAERADLVREALTQLAPEDRQILEAAYYQGLTQSELAARDGIPLGTVKSRARQALKKLRIVLNHLV
jgi:RNA polymerase sigma-70 factor, ECF subfamily